MPNDHPKFVDLTTLVPSVVPAVLYATPYNFLGRAAHGYKASKVLMIASAAQALAHMSRTVAKDGYCLVIYDAYRPQKAVRDFANWGAAPLPHSKRTKQLFHPTLARHELFEKGYISSQSAHSRGFTVDLTLIKKGSDFHPQDPIEHHFLDADGSKLTILDDGSLDMGGHFDLFHPLSHQNATGLSSEAQENRAYLNHHMKAVGFQDFDMEWWHFTHESEPKDAPFFDSDIV